MFWDFRLALASSLFCCVIRQSCSQFHLAVVAFGGLSAGFPWREVFEGGLRADFT